MATSVVAGTTLPKALPNSATFFTLDSNPSKLGIDPEANAPALSSALRTSTKSYAALNYSNSPSALTSKFPQARFNLILGTRRADYLIGSSRADFIFGFGGADTIFGGGGSDRIFGGRGLDILNGQAGNDILKGGSGNDLLDGGSGNDELFGQDGNDQLFGSKGNDLLDGGSGRDIANYSKLGKAVTLQAIGVLKKSGLGTDQLKAVEVIVGANNQRNKIDGATASGSTTYLDVDLAAESLSVRDIPVIGAQSFTIQNFTDVVGSRGNDSILGSGKREFLFGNIGNDTINGRGGNDLLDGGPGDDQVSGGSGNDRILGSAGNDVLDGGSGNDRVTYKKGMTLAYDFDTTFSNPNAPPTGLTPQLKALKNNGELVALPDQRRIAIAADRLDNIERVVGAAGETNSINFSYSQFRPRFGPPLEGFAPAINLDLGAKRLKYGNEKLVVENFVNALGSFENDRIKGDGKANELNGFAGEDRLIGGGGNDTLVANEADTLTGGSGADQFKFIAASVIDAGRMGAQFREIEANVVTDFEVGRDRLVFENSDGTLGARYRIGSETTRTHIPFRDLASGALPTDQFFVLGSSPAPDSAKFTYDGSSGDLFYKGDRNLPGRPRSVKIATLQGAPSISASDFLVV